MNALHRIQMVLGTGLGAAAILLAGCASMTKEEIKEAFLHVACYCGAPAALDSFRIAKKIFAETE